MRVLRCGSGSRRACEHVLTRSVRVLRRAMSQGRGVLPAYPRCRPACLGPACRLPVSAPARPRRPRIGMPLTAFPPVRAIASPTFLPISARQRRSRLGVKDHPHITHCDHPGSVQTISACSGWPSGHGPLMSTGVTRPVLGRTAESFRHASSASMNRGPTRGSPGHVPWLQSRGESVTVPRLAVGRLLGPNPSANPVGGLGEEHEWSLRDPRKQMILSIA